MTEAEIRRYVREERASLAAGADSDDPAEIVGQSRLSGTRIGLGLLYLGETAAAREWFAAVSESWLTYFEYYREKKLDEEASPRIGDLKWRGLLRGLQTAVLSGDPERIEASAETAVREATNPALEELPGADARPRVSAIAALASVLLDEPPDDHLDRLATRLESTERPHDRTLYPIVDEIVSALWRRDVEAVEDGVRDLEQYHESFRIDPGVAHVTEEAVNVDACALVVAARRCGLDVRVESEYLPDAVYDSEAYPVDDALRDA